MPNIMSNAANAINAANAEQRLEEIKEAFETVDELRKGGGLLRDHWQWMVAKVTDMLELKRLNHWNYDQLAAALGVDNNKIYLWEKLHKFPYLQELARDGVLTWPLLKAWGKKGDPNVGEERLDEHNLRKHLGKALPTATTATATAPTQSAPQQAQQPAFADPFPALQIIDGTPQGGDLVRTIEVVDHEFPFKADAWKKRFSRVIDGRLGALDPAAILERHRKDPARNRIFFLVSNMETTLGVACTDFVEVAGIHVPHIRGYVVESAVEGKGYGGRLLLDVFEALGGFEFILADVVHGNKRSLKCLKRAAEATGRATTALGLVINDDLVPGSEAADDDLVEWCFGEKGNKNKKGRDIWTAAKAAEDAKKRKTKRSQGITAPPPEPAPKRHKKPAPKKG